MITLIFFLYQKFQATRDAFYIILFIFLVPYGQGLHKVILETTILLEDRKKTQI